MRRDRIIAGTSTALSLLIGAWLVLEWTTDQPAPVRESQALPSQDRMVAETAPPEAAARPHNQAVILPPPPAPVTPKPPTQAKPAPAPKPQPIQAMRAPKPAPKKVERKIEALQPSHKPAPKPVMKAVLKPVQPVRKPEPVTPTKPAEISSPEPDMQAFRAARKAPPSPKIFDALARFKALRAAQERAKPAPAAPWKIEVSAKAVTSGRVALRILEHGEGPEIEIAWPYSVRASNRLYHLFTACFGMKTAVMDSAGQLYTAAGGGRPWRINLDRYSGFVRQVSGRLSPQEASELRALQRLRSSRVSSVRIFPRSVDARLLGGLGQLLGKSYRSMGRIRATYRMTGSGVSVGQITADGKPIPGEIILRPITRRCSV